VNASATDIVEGMSLGGPAELLRSIWQVNHALEQASCAMDASMGVTSQQRMLIRCIGRYPSMTAGQVAKLFHVDAGTVSTALQRLERKGMVSRRRDHRDRRRVTLGLTAKGRTVDGLPLGPVERAAERLVEMSSPEDVARVRALLETLANLIRVDAPSSAVIAGHRRAG
jgi:MarR family transcriptional regulator, organic hydroperoxide resistance regulator